MSGSWIDQLQPASWRGVPFAVTRAETDYSRRTVVHQYPKRDAVWVEDLGAGKQPFGLSGFLIGDDALDQKAAMAAAVSKPGIGELVHPTMGTMRVVCVGFSTSESAERGRMVELAFTFIESGPRQYPLVRTDTKQGTKAAADICDVAASQSFALRAGPPIAQGGIVASQVMSTVQVWAATANRLARDATAVLRVAGSLTASVGGSGFGRFFRGARSTLGQAASATATVSSLISRATAARVAVSRAVSTVLTLGGRL